MDKETFLNKIKEIGTTEDEVQRRTLLTELNDDASSIFDENETLKTENGQVKEYNETLLVENRKLFMRVSSDKEEGQGEEGNQGNAEDEKLKFEDLFDEKGEIK